MYDNDTDVKAACQAIASPVGDTTSTRLHITLVAASGRPVFADVGSIAVARSAERWHDRPEWQLGLEAGVVSRLPAPGCSGRMHSSAADDRNPAGLGARSASRVTSLDVLLNAVLQQIALVFESCRCCVCTGLCVDSG